MTETQDPSPALGPDSIAPRTSQADVLSRLADIEVTATVELGTARLLLRDLAALAPGHVVELDRMVGDPADLRVNGHLFARGEIVVVEDQLGFRITQLVTRGQTDAD